MSLTNEIEKMRKEIRTDAYSMSIGEWINLYTNNEIDIHPEFQRIYRWNPAQKSNFIESILLGIPIPPIYVSQRADGIWDVIDGLQRLSTLYHFIGVLKGVTNENIEPLILEKTKYLPSLEGMKWDNSENPEKSFSQEQRLLLKRTKIQVSIILRESDEITKFELFQRLNTGGSHLTPQEVRNCIMVMVNPDFYNELRKLAKHSSFQDSIALSQNNLDEQYDIELALRFIIFANLDIDKYDKSTDVGDYITDKMVTMAADPLINWSDMIVQFQTTFDYIAKALGGNAFRRYSNEQFKGGFLLSPYEVIAYGLGYNHPNFPTIEKTILNVKQLYSNEIYQQWSGSGVRANSRLPQLIPLGRKLFSK